MPPTPPSGLPIGFTTTQLNAQPFFPNYNTTFYQKQYDREIIFPLKYVSKSITTGSSAFTIASLNLDPYVDYIMIQANQTISLSFASTTNGGLIIPANTIFNLPMNPTDLNQFTVNVNGTTSVTIIAFRIDY